MVSWLDALSGVFRGCDGSYELRLPFVLDSAAALHCGLLWLHHLDSCLCSEGEFSKLVSGGSSRNAADWFVAAQHDFDLAICLDAAGLLDMVSCQLFPHGRDGLPARNDLWRKTGSRVDDRLSTCSGSPRDSTALLYDRAFDFRKGRPGYESQLCIPCRVVLMLCFYWKLGLSGCLGKATSASLRALFNIISTLKIWIYCSCRMNRTERQTRYGPTWVILYLPL